MAVNSTGGVQQPNFLNLNRAPAVTPRQQVNRSFIAQQAEAALIDGLDSAAQDTLEDLSLALGSRLKNIKGDGAKSEEEIRNNLLQEIAGQSDVDAAGLEPGDIKALMAMVDAGNLPSERAILMLSSWRGAGKLAGKQKDEIDRQLNALLENDPDWALKLFATLELGEAQTATLSALQKVMERNQRQSGGEDAEKLWHWFEQISQWPDKEKRLRVLLRTCALELNCCLDESRQLQLTSVLFELKKILLFLGISDHAQRLAQICQLSQEQVLKMILLMVEQTWPSPEWVLRQLVSFDTPDTTKILYASGLRETMKLLPSLCFLDEEQREQILDAISVCYDKLSDDEM